MLIQNVRQEFTSGGQPALRIIRVDQIEHGIMAYEHENFDGPLPPRIEVPADKSKFVVSCFSDRENWAHLFYDWAMNLPVRDIQTVQTARADTDDDSDTDEVSEDSDNDSIDNDDDG
jgi:hypothetical protein